jgi:hypothetical protein
MHDAYIGLTLLFQQTKDLKIRLFDSYSNTLLSPCLVITPVMHRMEWRFVYSHFLKLPGATWRWVVSFMLRPLYFQRNSIRLPLNKRLAERNNRSRCNCDEKNRLSLPGIEHRLVGRPDISQNWFKRTRSTDKTVLLPHSVAHLLYEDLKLRKTEVSLAANQRGNNSHRVFTTKYATHWNYFIMTSLHSRPTHSQWPKVC